MYVAVYLNNMSCRFCISEFHWIDTKNILGFFKYNIFF
jgi:hypothetical protein